MLLKLRYDGPLSNDAFNCNLRRYAAVQMGFLLLVAASIRAGRSITFLASLHLGGGGQGNGDDAAQRSLLSPDDASPAPEGALLSEEDGDG
jgi:hypothetical protein